MLHEAVKTVYTLFEHLLPVTSENGGYRVGLLIFGIRYYEAAGVGRCRQTASVPPILNIVVRLEGDNTSGRLDRHELDPGSPRLSGRYEPWRQLYPYGIAFHVGKLHIEQLHEVEHKEFLARLGIHAAYLVRINRDVGFTPRQCVAVYPEGIVAQQPTLGYIPAGVPVIPVVGVGHTVPERRLLVGKGILALIVGRHGYPHRVNVHTAQSPLILRQKGSACAGRHKGRAAGNSKKSSKFHV